MPGWMPNWHLRATVCPQVRLPKWGQVLSHQRGLSVQWRLQGPQLPGPLLSRWPVWPHLWQILPLQCLKHTQVLNCQVSEEQSKWVLMGNDGLSYCNLFWCKHVTGVHLRSHSSLIYLIFSLIYFSIASIIEFSPTSENPPACKLKSPKSFWTASSYCPVTTIQIIERE